MASPEDTEIDVSDILEKYGPQTAAPAAAPQPIDVSDIISKYGQPAASGQTERETDVSDIIAKYSPTKQESPEARGLGMRLEPKRPIAPRQDTFEAMRLRALDNPESGFPEKAAAAVFGAPGIGKPLRAIASGAGSAVAGLIKGAKAVVPYLDLGVRPPKQSTLSDLVTEGTKPPTFDETLRAASQATSVASEYGAPTEYFKKRDWKGAAASIWYNVLEATPQFAAAAGSAALGQPEVGLSMLGLAATGNKMAQLEKDHPEMSPLKRDSIAAVTGAFEVLSERLGTFGYLNRITKSFGKEATKRTVMEVIKKVAPVFQESAEEAVAQLAENILDMSTGVKRNGKKVGLWDGVADSAIIALPMGAGPAAIDILANTRRATTGGTDAIQKGGEGQVRQPVGPEVQPEAGGDVLRDGGVQPQTNEAPAPGEGVPGEASVGAAGRTELLAENVTSLRNKQTDVERRQLWLPAADPVIRQTFPEVIDKADALLATNPNAGRDLVSELTTNPRALTATEDAILLRTQVEAQNRYNLATQETVRAMESGDGSAIDVANKKMAKASDELLQVYQAGKSAGTETARGLQARKMFMDEHFTLANMEMEFRAARGGKPLNQKERAELAALSDRYKATKAKLDEALAKLKEGDVAGEDELSGTTAKPKFDELVNKHGAAEPKPRKPSAPKDGEDLAGKIKRLYREEVESGVRDLETATNNVHAEIETSNPGMTKTQVRDLFSDYGKTKTPNPKESAKVLSDLRRQSQLVSSIERVLKKLAPLKTGLQRDKPTQRQRELTKQLNTLMKEAGITVGDPATQLASALAATKSRLENSIADLNKALATKTKMVDTSKPIEYDAEAKALVEQRDALRQQYDEMFPKEPLTDEQRLNVAIKAGERSISDWNKRLDDAKGGKFGKPTEATPLPKSAELDAIRAKRDAIKKEVQDLKDIAFPKRTPEESAILAKKHRLESATKEMQRRMRENDFTPKAKKTVDISKDPEALNAQAENEKVKLEYYKLREAARRANLSIGGRIKELGMDVAHTFKNFMSAYDVSAPGRQGGLYALSHPIKWIRALVPMFKALSSSQSLRINTEIMERPNAKSGVYQRAGLALTKGDGTGNFSQVEDSHRLDLAEKIPGVGASNRAYGTFLNKVRSDLFDHLLANSSNPSDTNTEKIKAIARGVEELTGRGDVGRHAETMALALWAPRFLKSSYDVITGRPLRTGPIEQRVQFAKEYGRALASLSAIYAIAAMFGAKTEKDPRSAQFGAIQIGNHTFNPLGFIRPTLTFLIRMITGQTKTQAGVHNLRDYMLPFATSKEGEGKVPFGGGIKDVTWQFIQSKLHPAIGLGLSIAAGQSFGREKMTPARIAEELFIPLTPRQSKDIFLQDDPDAAAVLSILNTLGFTVNPNYNSELDKFIQGLDANKPKLPKRPTRESPGAQGKRFAVTRWINQNAKSESHKKELMERAKKKMGWK